MVTVRQAGETGQAGAGRVVTGVVVVVGIPFPMHETGLVL